MLAAAGAKTQRLLWASTSTKNPAYKDTMYVEALIGRDTVDTIPPATMDAFRDHGEVMPDVIEQDVTGARAMLADAGAARHLAEGDHRQNWSPTGVQQFADAFDKLFGAIARAPSHAARRRSRPACDRLGSPTCRPPSMRKWRPGAKRGAFGAFGPATRRCGPGRTRTNGLAGCTSWSRSWPMLTGCNGFAEDVKQRGFTDVVLLGMGGSSLGPEVLARLSGQQSGWPRFHMLDSTDPAQIKAIEQAIDLGKTLFIVSSKSGSTLEPNIFMDYFFDRVGAVRGKEKAGEHFVAVTDPARRWSAARNNCGFADIFLGVTSIGGRYSVLSKFGLVPAAAMGIDVKRFLETTQPMERACGADVPPAENPGVQLGIAMGVAARRFGRDKVTIIASPGIADLGAWLEQLLAESTGKHGRGLIPLADEPLTAPEHYGSDRFFAYLELDGADDPSQRAGGGGAGEGRPSGRADQREGSDGTSVRNSSAGRSRPRWPARSSASIRSTSRTSRRARTRRAR